MQENQKDYGLHSSTVNVEGLKTAENYAQFKQQVDSELSRCAEGFVRIGYLLKQARDTDILSESGYKNVAEFAYVEYGLTKDIVSRYIAINDRYSEGGNSDRLQERYKNFGMSKLAEMLTLPDSVIDVLDPAMTRKEIQEIKAEIREEEKISDIEVMLEPSEAGTIWGKALRQYMQDTPEIYVAAAEMFKQAPSQERLPGLLMDIFAPAGIAALMSRVSGAGRIVISVKGKDTPVEFVSVRTGEKKEASWQQVAEMLKSIINPDVPAEQSYEQQFGISYPQKEKKESESPGKPNTLGSKTDNNSAFGPEKNLKHKVESPYKSRKGEKNKTAAVAPVQHQTEEKVSKKEKKNVIRPDETRSKQAECLSEKQKDCIDDIELILTAAFEAVNGLKSGLLQPKDMEHYAGKLKEAAELLIKCADMGEYRQEVIEG